MPPAIIGGVIAGVGALGAAVVGSSAQRKAAQTAADATQQATTENNALAREIYAKNTATLSPYVKTGYAATNALNSLLGLDQPSQTTQPAPQPDPSYYPGYYPQGTYSPGYNDTGYQQMGYSPDDPQAQEYGVRSGYGQQYVQQPQVQSVAPANPQTYQNAFDNYRNSTGYQFRVNEGMKSLNSGWAAKGLLNSGAAQKAALGYGQNIASGEFNNYLSQLGSQQGVGLSAGNALAGVSTGYANQVANQNNSQAGVLANAALAGGQSQAALWGGAAGALGQIGGSVISSYQRPQSNAYGISGAGNIY